MQNRRTNDNITQISLQKLFQAEYDLPFKFILLNLIFNSFRPDLLFPGGKIAMYLPLLLSVLLFFQWLKVPNKDLSNLQTKYLLAFFILMIIQLPFARNYYRTFMHVKFFFIYIILAFLFRIQFLDTCFKIEKYIKLTVIFGLFFAFLGIGGQGKVPIPILKDENDFCLWMNILFALAYFLGQDSSEKRNKIFWYSCGTIFLLANVASFSRGGFLGLIAVGFFILYKSKQKVLALFLVGIFALFLYFFTPSIYWEEMNTIHTENVEAGTGKQRIDLWKAGWKMFLDHPIIGVGANNYGMWLPDYFPHNPSRWWGEVAHSLFFTLIPEMGIIGTLIFCGMLYGNYRSHKYLYELDKKKHKLFVGTNVKKDVEEEMTRKIKTLYNLSLAYSGALIAYIATGAFIAVLWYGYFWKFTSFWVMTINTAKNIEKELLKIQSCTHITDNKFTYHQAMRNEF